MVKLTQEFRDFERNLLRVRKKKYILPENAPFDRSTRSRTAKKSLLSRRYLRDPKRLLIELQKVHRM